MELSEDAWWDSLTRIHASSLRVRHNLIQFKVLQCLPYSRDKFESFPAAQIQAVQGAAIVHSLGRQHVLGVLLSQIFSVFSYICKQTMTPDFHTAIFGIPKYKVMVTTLQWNV